MEPGICLHAVRNPSSVIAWMILADSSNAAGLIARIRRPLSKRRATLAHNPILRPWRRVTVSNLVLAIVRGHQCVWAILRRQRAEGVHALRRAQAGAVQSGTAARLIYLYGARTAVAV